MSAATGLQESNDKNLELVRAMGADWYDPIPPDQYDCFLDPAFTLTPRGHRMLACIRSHTIRGKKGGRTPYMADGRRTLLLKHIQAELDWDMPSTLKVWAEIEEHGLARRDEKGRIWLCGKVIRGGRNEGEDQEEELDHDQAWEKFCTDNFPTYLAKQFQQLSKNERHNVHTDVEVWQQYAKRVEAEAMAAAREQVQKVQDRYFAERYRVTVRRFERKEKEGAPPKPKPIVQLALLEPPKLSVQNFEAESVQGGNPTLYKVETDPVQTLLNRSSENSENQLSGSASKRDGNKASEKASTSSSFSVVRDSLARFGTVDDDVFALLLRNCRQQDPDCTPEEIISFLDDKALLLNRNTRNPVGFLVTAIPKCFTESFRRERERPTSQTQPEEWSAAEQIEMFEKLLAESSAENVNREYWREQLAALKRKPAESEPAAGKT